MGACDNCFYCGRIYGKGPRCFLYILMTYERRPCPPWMLQKAARTNAVILVRTEERRRELLEMAERMGLKIPEPVLLPPGRMDGVSIQAARTITDFIQEVEDVKQGGSDRAAGAGAGVPGIE